MEAHSGEGQLRIHDQHKTQASGQCLVLLALTDFRTPEMTWGASQGDGNTVAV